MLEVVAAIIINEAGEILIAQRKANKSMGGLWEFPGGKIETGETPEDSLIREIKEEMNIDIEVQQYFGENIHNYGDKIIKLMAYYAKKIKGEIKLQDHESCKWVMPKALKEYKFSAADQPFVEELIKVGE